MFLRCAALLAYTVLAGDPAADEDDGSSTYGIDSDYVGLIACALIFIPIFVYCCWKENTREEEEDVEAPWVAKSDTKKFMPNPELINKVYLDILTMIDLDGDGATADLRELSTYFGAGEAQSLIKKFDKNNSGTLSVWEIKEMWPDLEEAKRIRDLIEKKQDEEFEKLVPILKEIVQKLDADGTGCLDAKELACLFSSEDHAARVISFADRDGNGTVDIRELPKIFPTVDHANLALRKLNKRFPNHGADIEITSGNE